MSTPLTDAERESKYNFAPASAIESPQPFLPAVVATPLQARAVAAAAPAINTALAKADAARPVPVGSTPPAQPIDHKVARVAAKLELISAKKLLLKQQMKEINEKAFKALAEGNSLYLTQARQKFGHDVRDLRLELANLEQDFKALPDEDKLLVQITQEGIKLLQAEYNTMYKAHVIADELSKLLDKAMDLARGDVKAVPLYADLFRRLHALQNLHKDLVDIGSLEKAEIIKGAIDLLQIKIRYNLPLIIKKELMEAADPKVCSFEELARYNPQRVADLLDCYDFLMLNGLIDDDLKQLKEKLDQKLDPVDKKPHIIAKRDHLLYLHAIVAQPDKVSINHLEQLRDAEDAQLHPNLELRNKIDEIIKKRDKLPSLNTERDKLLEFAKEMANEPKEKINKYFLTKYQAIVIRLGELAFIKGDTVAEKQLMKLIYALELKGNDKVRQALFKNKEAHAVLVKLFQNTPLIASMMANGELPRPTTPGELSRAALFYKKVIIDLGGQAIKDKNDVRAEQAFKLVLELANHGQLNIINKTPEGREAIQELINWKELQIIDRGRLFDNLGPAQRKKYTEDHARLRKIEENKLDEWMVFAERIVKAPKDEILNHPSPHQFANIIIPLGRRAFEEGDVVVHKQLLKMVYALALKGDTRVLDAILKNKEAKIVWDKLLHMDNLPFLAEMMANNEIRLPTTPDALSKAALFYKKVIIDLGMKAIKENNVQQANHAFELLAYLVKNDQLKILEATPTAKNAILAIVEWKFKQLRADYVLEKNVNSESANLENVVRAIGADPWSLQFTDQIKFDMIKFDILRLGSKFGQPKPKGVKLSEEDAAKVNMTQAENEFIAAIRCQKQLNQFIEKLSNGDDPNDEKLLKFKEELLIQANNQKNELDVRVRQHQKDYFPNINISEISTIITRIENIQSKINN